MIADDVVKEKYAEKEPYGEWLDSNLLELKDLKIPNEPVPTYGAEEREKLMKAFGYTYEDIRTAILPMALNGSEAIAAMGNDTPLAVLSNRHQPLFNYFKQLFAQVTNPPIDAIREELVTSTTVYVGKEGIATWFSSTPLSDRIMIFAPSLYALSVSTNKRSKAFSRDVFL